MLAEDGGAQLENRPCSHMCQHPWHVWTDAHGDTYFCQGRVCFPDDSTLEDEDGS